MEKGLLLPFSNAPDKRHKAAPDRFDTIFPLGGGEPGESCARFPSADPPVNSSRNAPKPPGARRSAGGISAIAGSKDIRLDAQPECSAAGVARLVECHQHISWPAQLCGAEGYEGASLTWLERSAIWIGMKDAAAGHAPFRPGSTWTARLYQNCRRWTAQSSPLPLADPYLEALRSFGLQIGQQPSVLIEDNREPGGRNR